jgi:exopolysaccharide biosynthesis polyprenyl glycosylphosphotransferase
LSETPGDLVPAAPAPTGTGGQAGVSAAAPAERLSPGLTWLFERDGYFYVTLVVDAILLLASVLLADLVNPAPSYLPALLVSPLTLALLAHRRLYDPHAQIGRLDRVASIAASTAMAAIVIAGLIQLLRPPATDSDLVAIQLGFATALLVGWRVGWSTLRLAARRAGRSGRPTLIVGAGEVGARLEQHLLRFQGLGLIPVGFVDADPVPEDELHRRHAPVLGGPAEFDAIVDETGARHAIVAFQQDSDVNLRRVVRRCNERELDMAIVPRLFDDVTNRMVLEHIGGIPLFELRQIDPRGWQFALKHGLDRVFAALLLLLLSPLLLAIALAVRLGSGSPVLFRQRRVGRDGQVFEVLKFRTMREPTEAQQALPGAAGDLAPGGVEGEDRRTPIGRFLRAWSLDELPQFFNVLRGEMSLIGPRPERPELAGDFAERVRRYDERHRVRSGITGWAQVNSLGPRTSLADRAEWDNWYIQNWSFWLDLKIAVLTIPALLRRSE